LKSSAFSDLMVMKAVWFRKELSNQ